MVSFNLSKRKLLLSVSKLQLILLLCTVIPHNLSAQGFIETGYTPQRNLLDKDDKKHGSGDLFQISGRYTLPLSVKRNEKGQVVAWSATINCVYSVLNNKDEALDINPAVSMEFARNRSGVQVPEVLPGHNNFLRLFPINGI